MYLAEALVEKGYRVEDVSLIMSKNVERYLSMMKMKPVNLQARLFTRRVSPSLLWFETWSREAFFRLAPPVCIMNADPRKDSEIRIAVSIALAGFFIFIPQFMLVFL